MSKFWLTIASLLSIFCLVSPSHGSVTFIDIWEFRVEGNTILEEQLIQRRLERFLGVARTIEDVEQAVEVLTQEYRNAGYPAVFVDIPPQSVVNGRFKLRVTETKLRRVKVSDATYFLPSAIKEDIPSLTRGRAINLPSLQREIQQVNTTNPNLKVIPVLKQGPTPEQIDVELSVADELPVSGGFEVNNYNTSTTTDTRASFNLGYTNLWQKHHSWSITAQTSPEDTDEVKVLSTSYVMPVSNDGDKWALYAVSSDSNTATVGNIRVVGEGFIVGARRIIPFSQKNGNIKTMLLGFDYKDFDELISTAGTVTTTTPIDYLTLTGQFSQYQRTADWYDSLSLALTLGVRGILNENDEFNLKRSLGEPNFSVLKAEYERNIPLKDDWLFTHKLSGQLTDGPLVSNEQISAGGVSSVRGFFESQISGDSGVMSSAQFTTPNLNPESDWLNDNRGVFFLEGAYLLKNDTLPDERKSVGISGIGFGLRATAFKKIKFDLDVGYAIEGEGDIREGDRRTNVSLKYEF